MHDPMRRLISELREEKCPQVVLDRVEHRVRESKLYRHSPFPFVWALATILIIGAATAAWFGQAQRREIDEARAHAERAQIVAQTQGALAYIGQILLETVAHNEQTILNEAMPPLRNGFETAKNKVINPI